MKKFKVMTLAMCLLTIFSCQTKQGTGALIGTGGGAVLRGIGRESGCGAVFAAGSQKGRSTGGRVPEGEQHYGSEGPGLRAVRLT